MSKAGSSERGEACKKLADTLNRIERVKSDVSARSVREHLQVLHDRRRAKNREEEEDSGIAPDEMTENETVLDEMISFLTQQLMNIEVWIKRKQREQLQKVQ